MILKNLYTSVGVNRTPLSLDWGNNKLICYAASNSIAILDPHFDDSCKLIKTFAYHSDRVNVVKWIKRNDKDNEFEIISGSDDNTCIYINAQDEDNPKVIILKGHKASVTAVDGIWYENCLTIVTAGADSEIKIWTFDSDLDFNKNVVECSQTIQLNRNVCFNAKFTKVSNYGVLLAAGTDDDKIRFYIKNSSNAFEQCIELKGHEDWIRGLDFIPDDSTGDILLASSSQDSFIRIWKISPSIKDTDNKQISMDTLISVDEKSFIFNNTNFIVKLESILQGHENWVYSVHWNFDIVNQSFQLLSSSMDRTMIIWIFDKELGIWTEKVRVGDVGGNNLGFYGAKFSSNGKYIIGHGFQGSLHLWHQQSDENDKLWEPGIIQSGHFREVKDIEWDPLGSYLMSVSMDQTTRLHSAWKRGDNRKETYHEIARPQVHGYDMQCLAILSKYSFASAAEEKIIRVFQAPANFVENYRYLSKVEKDCEGDKILNSNQKGAAVPSLGLSNKIVYEEDLQNPINEQKKFTDEYPENYFVPMSMTSPPTEEYLVQNTLWPELHKLYAHGYELYSLASRKDGTILASACKATNYEHAEIILWDTKSWKILQRLRSHKLTVTQMKFSSDGNYLLSVSRDRKWSLFKNDSDANEFINFQLVSTSDKENGVHKRIIWCCDFSHDDKFFATGSRDGIIAFWGKNDETENLNYHNILKITMEKESVTALSFAQKHWKEKNYLIAAGFESGSIQLYGIQGNQYQLLHTLNHLTAHHLSVNKLQFRPSLQESYHLASCGNDNTIRIYEILDE